MCQLTHDVVGPIIDIVVRCRIQRRRCRVTVLRRQKEDRCQKHILEAIIVVKMFIVIALFLLLLVQRYLKPQKVETALN